MTSETRNALVAAAVFLAFFGLLAFFLPTIMLAAGETSPWLAGLVAVAFVAAFFGVLWLRGRSKGGN